MVLRTGTDFVEFGERGELRLRQAFDHARGEDRGVALHGDAKQETDLHVEHIAARLGFRGTKNLQLFTTHDPAPPSAFACEQASQREKACPNWRQRGSTPWAKGRDAQVF